MIELGVMQLLAATAAIETRVSRAGSGKRIYVGRIPESMKIDGGTIVVKKIGRTREYGLAGEAASKFTTLQIDCYDLLPAAADSLAELVTAAVSGTAAIGLVAGDHVIESSEIVGERTEHEKPKGASDDWRPRDSRDYRLHHT